MSFISPSKALAHVDRLAGWKLGDHPAPVTVEWDLSNRCPLGCFACHFAHTHSKGPWVKRERRLPMAFEGTGDIADMDVVRRGLAQMAACGVRGVVWAGGGEPTTHPEWVRAVESAAALGMQSGLYTAGILVNRITAMRYASAGTWAVVSLDCIDQATYRQEKQTDGFHKACEGILALVGAKVETVGVSFLVHGGNWRSLEQMVALGRSLGATYVTLRPAIETFPDDPTRSSADLSWLNDALPIIEALSRDEDVETSASRFAQYRDWNGRSYETCHGPKLNATITPDGRVWRCPQHRGLPGSFVGDLTTEHFKTMWSRYSGEWTDFSACRVMCRLHMVNQEIAPVFERSRHESFV